MKHKKNLIFILIILALLILPFINSNQNAIGGTDQIAMDTVKEIAPDYQPIAKHFFVPANQQIETLLFALQGITGAAFICYYIGTKKINSKRKNSTG